MKAEGKMVDLDLPLEYRGYRIYQATGKSVPHHNSVSGHKWSTPTFKNAFTLVGSGTSSQQEFGSIKKAQEQIDFIIKYPPAHAQEAVARILDDEARADQAAGQDDDSTENEESDSAPRG